MTLGDVFVAIAVTVVPPPPSRLASPFPRLSYIMIRRKKAKKGGNDAELK